MNFKEFFRLEINDNRVFGLDILRAVAILFVIILHTNAFLPNSAQPIIGYLVFDGVGVFFVLSGFLIGGILIKDLNKYKFNSLTLRSFWIKRWSRTLPNYFLYLFFSILLIPFIYKDFSTYNLVNYATFTHNLFSAPPDSFYGHSWSLSVEEWFYLLTPMLMMALYKLTNLSLKKVFLATSIFIIFIINFFRIKYFFDHPQFNYELFKNLRYAVFYRFDSLMYGILGAYIYYYYSDFWLRIKKPCLILGAALFFLSYLSILKENYMYRSLITFNLTSITVFLFLPSLSLFKQTQSAWRIPITYISLISYSWYLSNSIIIDILKSISWEGVVNYIQENIYPNYIWTFVKFFNYVLSWVLSFSLSLLTFKYFELPSTEYLRKKLL